MSEGLNIGDFSRDGLLQITGKSWDSNGTMTVSVREMIGGADGWIGGWPRVRAKMRRFAKRALPEYHVGQTKSVRFVRTWSSGGCTHATFLVSRLER